MDFLNNRYWGQSLIEVILSLALFLVFVVGASTLTSSYVETTQRSNELLDAEFVATDTFEAIESIAQADFSDLSNSTGNGLSDVAGYWELIGAPDLVAGVFTRTIDITPIYRDENCDIVTSGGTEDPSAKEVEVTLDWNESGIARTQTFQRLYTEWRSPSLFCVQEEGDSLVIDTSNVGLGESGSGGGSGVPEGKVQVCHQAGNKEFTIIVNDGALQAHLNHGDYEGECGSDGDDNDDRIVGITLENTGTEDITLTEVMLTWTGGSQIEIVEIGDAVVWEHDGVGTPNGRQDSGTILDIDDIILPFGSEIDVDYFEFDEDMDNQTVTVTFYLSDGSFVTTPSFQLDGS